MPEDKAEGVTTTETKRRRRDRPEEVGRRTLGDGDGWSEFLASKGLRTRETSRVSYERGTHSTKRSFRVAGDTTTVEG